MSKKPFNVATNKTLKIVLTVIMLAAVLLSAWLFLSPTLDKQDALKKQDALIEKIEKIYEEPVSVPEILSPIVVPELPIKPMPMPIILPEPTPEPEPEKEPVPIGTELGILSIEKLNMKLPVVEGITEEILKIAVGHVPQTAAIGDTGNAVIAGHRMYDYGSFFNRLGEVVLGDIIVFTSTNGTVMSFEVDEILEIEPGDQIAFVQPEDKAQITLYTCTPIREATHRLLVRASLL